METVLAILGNIGDRNRDWRNLTLILADALDDIGRDSLAEIARRVARAKFEYRYCCMILMDMFFLANCVEDKHLVVKLCDSLGLYAYSDALEKFLKPSELQ